MPFTFSHPALILPFGKLSKKWVSFTGLFIGAISPDFEYFIRMKILGVFSHTLSGLFWFCMPAGLILTFVFHNLVRDPLIDNLPKVLKSRFDPCNSLVHRL